MPNFAAWTPDDWSALAGGVTAAVAVLAAIFAYFQVREARRTREAQAQPFVVVDIQPSRVSWNIANLVVENLGTTLARDVKIRFTPEIATSRQGYDLAGSALLREGIPTLPPRRRIEAFFDVGPERAKANLPPRYEAEVSFSDAWNRRQEPLRYVIDLNYLYGLQRVEEYGVHHAAKSLREIERVMKRLTWAGRLRVAVEGEGEGGELAEGEPSPDESA